MEFRGNVIFPSGITVVLQDGASSDGIIRTGGQDSQAGSLILGANSNTRVGIVSGGHQAISVKWAGGINTAA